MAYQAPANDILRQIECAWKAEGRRFDPAPDHPTFDQRKRAKLNHGATAARSAQRLPSFRCLAYAIGGQQIA